MNNIDRILVFSKVKLDAIADTIIKLDWCPYKLDKNDNLTNRGWTYGDCAEVGYVLLNKPSDGTFEHRGEAIKASQALLDNDRAYKQVLGAVKFRLLAKRGPRIPVIRSYLKARNRM